MHHILSAIVWIGGVFFLVLVVALELLVFAVVLVVSAIHDFRIGSRAVAAIARDAASPEATVLRRRASQLGRLNAVLSLVLVLLAVLIVRGSPF